MISRREALAGTGVLIPAGIVVASCSTTGGLSQSLMDIVTQVQQGVATACGFLASVSSVVALVGGLNPIIGGVTAAISAICAAIPPAAAAAPRAGKQASFVVQGVVVTGIFVR